MILAAVGFLLGLFAGIVLARWSLRELIREGRLERKW